MKIKIKDLTPNPFRDFVNYPRDEKKIEELIKSINKTFFWDNLLARERGGKYEISYGHHRYVALKRLFKPNDTIDIPVKDMDDWTMIMVMIDENMDQYGTNQGIQNEGVKAAFGYLTKAFPFREEQIRGQGVIVFDGISIPKKSRYFYLAAQIAERLGDIRKEKRVYHSLRQLEATGQIEIPEPKKSDEKKEKKTGKKKKKRKKEAVELNKAAVGILEKTSYVDRFFNTLQRLLKQKGLKISKAKQLEVAKKLVAIGKFDSATMAKELVASIQTKKDDKKEDKVVELEEYLREASNLIDKLDGRVREMIKIKDVLDSPSYEKSIEKTEFKIKAAFLVKNLKILLGGKFESKKLTNGRH